MWAVIIAKKQWIIGVKAVNVAQWRSFHTHYFMEGKN